MVLLPRKSPQLLLSHFALFLFFSQVLVLLLIAPLPYFPPVSAALLLLPPILQSEPIIHIRKGSF